MVGFGLQPCGKEEDLRKKIKHQPRQIKIKTEASKKNEKKKLYIA